MAKRNGQPQPIVLHVTLRSRKMYAFCLLIVDCGRLRTKVFVKIPSHSSLGAVNLFDRASATTKLISIENQNSETGALTWVSQFVESNNVTDPLRILCEWDPESVIAFPLDTLRFLIATSGLSLSYRRLSFNGRCEIQGRQRCLSKFQFICSKRKDQR